MKLVQKRKCSPLVEYRDRIVYRGTCWCWAGACSSKGYGSIHREGSSRTAHRVFWELCMQKKLRRDRHLDHLCRNITCCNPAHLERVTPKENRRRQAEALRCA